MEQVTMCTNPKIGNALEMLDYTFSGSTPERQAEYEAHLLECTHCLHKRKKVLNKKRLAGLGLTFGGLALATLSLLLVWLQAQSEATYITIPHGLFLVGLGLSGKGLWQIVRGKSSGQK